MDPFLAEIVIFAGNFAPRGWAYCDGQLMSINANSALFSLLGTTYGGDGRTTFALPDLRGRTPVGPRHGPGLSSYTLGQRGGVETVTLTINQMPSHSHIATATQPAGLPASGTINAGGAGSTSDPAGKFPGKPDNIGPVEVKAYADAGGTPMAAGTVSVDLSGLPAPTVTVLNNGGSQYHTNIQPFLAINYIIATQGVFPSRN